METIMPWLAAHWNDVLAVWGGVVALASVVVKLTPTQADDAVLAKVVKVADWFSVITPKSPKDVTPAAKKVE